MKRTLCQLPENVPESIRKFAEGATVYDSSCSQDARVYFIDHGDGFYLKHSAKSSLVMEALMGRFFHYKGLGPEVLVYERQDGDWLLTARAKGEDCTDPMYMVDPKRLCDTTAELLRRLHETDFGGCPVPDRTGHYLATARRNYKLGQYDTSLFPDNWGYATPEDALRVMEENGKYLKNDTLIHGDYCLPNIILDHWDFSGFIDLGCGGVGDRHIDLFWGIWSLQFNLKTDQYRTRFLDAYGRDKVNADLLPVIAAIEVFG